MAVLRYHKYWYLSWITRPLFRASPLAKKTERINSKWFLRKVQISDGSCQSNLLLQLFCEPSTTFTSGRAPIGASSATPFCSLHRMSGAAYTRVWSIHSVLHPRPDVPLPFHVLFLILAIVACPLITCVRALHFFFLSCCLDSRALVRSLKCRT